MKTVKAADFDNDGFLLSCFSVVLLRAGIVLSFFGFSLFTSSVVDNIVVGGCWVIVSFAPISAVC